MRIAILFSGGKDSVNTLWYYREQAWDIACLCTLIPRNPDSFMFQQPDEKLVRAQAQAVGVPLLVRYTAGEEGRELDDLHAVLAQAKQQFGITGVAVGALASDYQHERVTRICDALDLTTYAPLWHKDQERLLREMIEAGFDIRMTRVAADGLTREWLGRRLTSQDVDRLVVLQRKLGLHVGGEGGEFETIVLDGPCFANPLGIKFSVEMESECRGELRITHVDA